MTEYNDSSIRINILNGEYKGVSVISNCNNAFDEKVEDLNNKFQKLNIPITISNVENTHLKIDKNDRI